jgi:hypothetical protein
MSILGNKIKNIIHNQIPNHIIDENPGFVNFLKAYYEWLECVKINFKYIDESTNKLSVGDIITSGSCHILKFEYVHGTGGGIYGPFVAGKTIGVNRNRSGVYVWAKVLKVDSENNLLYVDNHDRNMPLIVGDRVRHSDLSSDAATILSVTKSDNFLNNNTYAQAKVKSIDNTNNILYVDMLTEKLFQSDEIIRDINFSKDPIQITSIGFGSYAGSQRLISLRDLERTLDDYIDHFKRELAYNIPKDIFYV